jgi:hypothetical protein
VKSIEITNIAASSTLSIIFKTRKKSKTDVGKEIIRKVLKMEGTIHTYDTRPITAKLTRFVCGKE